MTREAAGRCRPTRQAPRSDTPLLPISEQVRWLSRLHRLTHVYLVLLWIVNDLNQPDDVCVATPLHDSDFLPNVVHCAVHDVRGPGAVCLIVLPQQLDSVAGVGPLYDFDSLPTAFSSHMV